MSSLGFLLFAFLAAVSALTFCKFQIREKRFIQGEVYVGRTKKLRRRLYTNHLHGNKSTARLKQYIVEDKENFPQINSYDSAKEWIKDNCFFQYIEVEESRERGHIEGLLGFLLDSRYIEEEH
jgi:hypothetical protein